MRLIAVRCFFAALGFLIQSCYNQEKSSRGTL
nr:MAG TPA: hypothetical protein [Caudoviricetes sp.]